MLATTRVFRQNPITSSPLAVLSYLNALFFNIFSDLPVTYALIGHFVSITVLYVLQACINLIGSPTGCTVQNSEKLDGFDMGGYFEKPHRIEPEKQRENGAIKQQLIRNYESTQLN